jgi:hypothetical protein
VKSADDAVLPAVFQTAGDDIEAQTAAFEAAVPEGLDLTAI